MTLSPPALDPEGIQPCPFCDSSNVSPGGTGEDSHWVRCIACNGEGPWAPTKAEAIVLWNRRAALPPVAREPVAVRPLVWQKNWVNDPFSGFALSEAINRAYTIEHDGPRFYVSTRLWAHGESDEGVANCDSFDAAKGAAQADYVSRILAAIDQPAAREPVAWRYRDSFTDRNGWDVTFDAKEAAALADAGEGYEIEPLYADQPAVEITEERRGIYIASKVVHADRWRLLRNKIGYPIISSWIDEAGSGQSQDLADLWRRCISEASRAEVLVFNAEAGELFKGAWIELGAALAKGVPVLAVGIDKIEGLTIAHDPRIQHFASMKDIMALLKPMVNGTRFAALQAAINPKATP